MPPKQATELQAFVQKLFLWLLGIFGTLFTMAASAITTILWTMNASVSTLNERVGTVVENQSRLYTSDRSQEDRLQLVEHEHTFLKSLLTKKRESQD